MMGIIDRSLLLNNENIIMERNYEVYNKHFVSSNLISSSPRL